MLDLSFLTADNEDVTEDRGFLDLVLAGVDIEKEDDTTVGIEEDDGIIVAVAAPVVLIFADDRDDAGERDGVCLAFAPFA